jgi:hypothetical protein
MALTFSDGHQGCVQLSLPMQRSGSTEAVPPRPALCRGQEYEYWALDPRPSHVNSFFSPDALQENISTFEFIHNISRIS